MLIIDIPMPKNCEDCLLCETVYMDFEYCKLYCLAKDREEIEIITEGVPTWCPICGVLPDEHGDLVDFNDVSKELRKYGYIVEDETTGMKHMEYPIVLEQNPISIPIIVPAERKDDGIKQI